MLYVIAMPSTFFHFNIHSHEKYCFHCISSGLSWTYPNLFTYIPTVIQEYTIDTTILQQTEYKRSYIYLQEHGSCSSQRVWSWSFLHHTRNRNPLSDHCRPAGH